MVDLDRLTIKDRGDGRRGGGWKVAALCLLCLGAGFGAAKLLDWWTAPDVLRVRTAVVRPATGDGGRQFTAGGWVEPTTPAYPIVVSCRISERLEALRVHEGQIVQPGQEIARMYDKDIGSRLAVARAKHDAAQKTLAKMRAGFRSEDVRAAAAKAAGVAETLRIAQANYGRSKGLRAGAISKEELDKELSAVTEAQAAHAEATAELDKLRAGYRVEDVAVAQANVNEADSVVKLAELSLSYCTIAVPAVGRPLRVLKVLHRVGQWIDARKDPALVWLYDPTDMQVRVDVTQANVKSIRVGGEAIVTTEADAQKKYKGKVLRAEPLAELSKNTVTVRVKIEDPDAMLFPEMVAQVTFLAVDEGGEDGKAAGLLVPSEAVIGQGDQRHVFVSDGGQARRLAVTVLADHGRGVVIGRGLRSGQRVIVSDIDKLSDGQRIEEE